MYTIISRINFISKHSDKCKLFRLWQFPISFPLEVEAVQEWQTFPTLQQVYYGKPE